MDRDTQSNAIQDWAYMSDADTQFCKDLVLAASRLGLRMGRNGDSFMFIDPLSNLIIIGGEDKDPMVGVHNACLKLQQYLSGEAKGAKT